jgi:hypothetical protein
MAQQIGLVQLQVF